MTKRMLIDAAHAEEVRVVILENDRIEEFEVESASKEQIRGNVYVAEIQRVEPSLQACFVDFGGNRNGFLAFSEIHPHYFDLPDEEKEALMKELEEISQRRSAPRPSGPRRHARGGQDRHAEGRPQDENDIDDDITEGLQPLSAESAAELEEENLEAVKEASEKVAAIKADKKNDGRRRPRRVSRSAAQNTDKIDSEEEEEEEDFQSIKIANASAPAGGDKPISATRLSGDLTAEEMEEDARALALANSMIVKKLSDDDIPPALQAEQKARGGRDRGGRDNKGRGRERNNNRGRDNRKPHNTPAPAAPASIAPATADDKAPAAQSAAPRTERNETHQDNNSGRRQQPIHRRYNIGDVLKRGQKLLVQVAKEERGTKGAALTTFVSLPGRFTVLMPNTPYAGGISRKITDIDERRQLKNITEALNVPEGMGLIVRTAGLGQSQENITQDLKHLLSHWERISKSWKEEPARTCVHEDGSLIIRALRDMFSDDISEIIVSGAKAQKACKEYMKAIIPDHVKLLKEHKSEVPLFSEYGVELELHHMNRSRVNLPSGGYLIINPTEALVSVDVNSGRSTGERNIEETAVKTNLEAAEELGRQLRLRDLAGLIVIDFIDMDDRRNERAVERAMRDAVKRDRARIQIGQISDFGLLEMSRQRMRPSLGETSFVTCPHCQGNGLVRSPASSALMILRGLEEEDIAGKADRVIITTSHDVAAYLLNYKRDMVADMESRYKTRIIVMGEADIVAPDHRLDLVRVEADGTEKKTTIENRWREMSAEEEQANSKRRKRRRGGGRKGRDDDKPQAAAKSDRPDRNDKQGRGNKGRDNRRNRNDAPRDDEAPQKTAAPTAATAPAEAPKTTESQATSTAAPAPEAETGAERRRPRRTQLGRRRDRNKDAAVTEEVKAAAPAATAATTPAPAEKAAPVAKPKPQPIMENKPVERVVVKAVAETPSAVKPAPKKGRVRTTKATAEAKPKAAAKAKSRAVEKPAENKPLIIERIGSDGTSTPTPDDAAKKSVFQRWWSK